MNHHKWFTVHWHWILLLFSVSNLIFSLTQHGRVHFKYWSACHSILKSTQATIFTIQQLLLITYFQIKFIWVINFAYYITNEAINSPKNRNKGVAQNRERQTTRTQRANSEIKRYNYTDIDASTCACVLPTIYIYSSKQKREKQKAIRSTKINRSGKKVNRFVQKQKQHHFNECAVCARASVCISDRCFCFVAVIVVVFGVLLR